jgi:hypothetical protein
LTLTRLDKQLTVGAEAVSVPLSVLAMHSVSSLSNDEAIWVHDGNDVEGVLGQVACDLWIGSSQQLSDAVLNYGTSDPLATVLET